MGVGTNAESGGQNLRFLGGSWSGASALASVSLVGSEWLTSGAGHAEEWTEALWQRNNSPYLRDGVPESELAMTTYRSGWVGWKDVRAAQGKIVEAKRKKEKKEKKENRQWRDFLFR